jgi:hypothetical protein
MAIATDAAPASPADRDVLAVQQSPESIRHRRHHVGVVAAACADLVERIGIGQAMRREKSRGTLAAKADVTA